MKIIAILPAYNAAKTIIPFVKTLPKGVFDKIILIDDCSVDGTYEIAKKIKKLSVYKTPNNLGYGGNLKMCIGKALEEKADLIIEIHPDGEYLTDGIMPSIKMMKNGYSLVLGNRFWSRKNILNSGMYLWKVPFTKLLTLVCNKIFATNIPDLHQGFRVYSKDIFKKINYQSMSNDYSFSIEIIAACVYKKLKIGSVSVSSNYKGKKRGASFKSSYLYSLKTLKIITLFLLAKIGYITKIFNNFSSNISCPNCNLNYLVEESLNFANKKIFFCKICNNGFLYPIPKKISSFYLSEYWNYIGFLGFVRKILFKYFQKRRITWVKKYLPNGGIVLDVGSGEGVFGLDLMHDSKFKVINIEPEFSKVKNSNVIKANFLNWEMNKKFDAICFWESLEHTNNPQEYIEKANFLLKRDGLLFIEYPIFDSLEAKIFRKNWFHLDIPRHLSFLTRNGVDIISKRIGFEKIQHSGFLAFEYGPPGVAFSINKSIYLLLPLSMIGLLMQLIMKVFNKFTFAVFVGRKNGN